MTSPKRHYVIFSLPKSGAQAFAATLDAGFLPLPFGKHYTASVGVPNGLHVEMPVRRELAAEMPHGGWLHTHAAATFATLDALQAIGARYIVMIRHPVDQIAAMYCHVAKYIDGAQPVPGHPELVYNLPMAPIRRALFIESSRIDEALAHLVRDGYLEVCLRWIADWLHWRDPRESRVVRYEDFIESPSRMVWEMQGFLSDCLGFNGNRLSRALSQLAAYRQSSFVDRKDSDRVYPRGWTGSAGVRTAYLSPALQDEAAAIVARFVRTYPQGRFLAEAYPDFSPAHEKAAARTA